MARVAVDVALRDLVAALLTGYQRVRPLIAAERRVLRWFVVYAAAATAFWRYRQYRVRFSVPERVDTWLEMRALADAVVADATLLSV